MNGQLAGMMRDPANRMVVAAYAAVLRDDLVGAITLIGGLPESQRGQALVNLVHLLAEDVRQLTREAYRDPETLAASASRILLDSQSEVFGG